MIPSEIINGFVAKAIYLSQSFALWFLPNDSQIYAMVQNHGHLQTLENFDELENLKGFVFSPFVVDDQHPAFILQPGLQFTGFDEMKHFIKDFQQSKFVSQQGESSKMQSTDKAQYIEGCQSLIDRISSGEAGKVVYSRIKILPNNSQQHPAGLLFDLHKSYPGAFCYLFYSPPTGLWMGASPETLLRKTGETMHTMALAGTRKCVPENKNTDPWPEKDIREQQFVTDYIRSKLKKIGIQNLQISKTKTHQAGAIEHIRTDFSFRVENNKNILSRVVEVLHPTPAVCGQPKKEAMQMIRETEKHQREYYSGFLGPVNFDNKTDLFVNLRCMKMIGTNFALYIGGGITSESVAENEWLETEMKADILGRVLGKK